MTHLKKTLRRTVEVKPYPGVKPEIVVSLYPGGLIGLREKCRRKEYFVYLEVLYQRAVKETVETERRKR